MEVVSIMNMARKQQLYLPKRQFWTVSVASWQGSVNCVVLTVSLCHQQSSKFTKLWLRSDDPISARLQCLHLDKHSANISCVKYILISAMRLSSSLEQFCKFDFRLTCPVLFGRTEAGPPVLYILHVCMLNMAQSNCGSWGGEKDVEREGATFHQFSTVFFTTSKYSKFNKKRKKKS